MLTLPVENFPFSESLGKIFFSPRKNYGMAHKLKQKGELTTNDNGTEH